MNDFVVAMGMRQIPLDEKKTLLWSKWWKG